MWSVSYAKMHRTLSSAEHVRHCPALAHFATPLHSMGDVQQYRDPCLHTWRLTPSRAMFQLLFCNESEHKFGLRNKAASACHMSLHLLRPAGLLCAPCLPASTALSAALLPLRDCHRRPVSSCPADKDPSGRGSACSGMPAAPGLDGCCPSETAQLSSTSPFCMRATNMSSRTF